MKINRIKAVLVEKDVSQTALAKGKWGEELRKRRLQTMIPTFAASALGVPLRSASRDVEARLVHFIFHIACPHHSLVFQDFCENRFERSDPPNFIAAVFVDLQEAIVRNVESRSVLMATVFRRVSVHVSQFLDVFFCSQN